MGVLVLEEATLQVSVSEGSSQAKEVSQELSGAHPPRDMPTHESILKPGGGVH